MKVTLNRAIKLRAMLEDLSVRVEPEGIELTNQMTLEEVEKIEQDTAALFIQNETMLLERHEHIMTLRNIIAEANHASSINQLIAEIARLEKLNKYFSGNYQSAVGIAGAELNKVKNAIKSEAFRVDNDPEAKKSLSTYVIRVPYLSDIVEHWKDSRDKVRLAIIEATEKRNALNHSTHVEIPTQVIEFLREFKIVK